MCRYSISRKPESITKGDTTTCQQAKITLWKGITFYDNTLKMSIKFNSTICSHLFKHWYTADPQAPPPPPSFLKHEDGNPAHEFVFIVFSNESDGLVSVKIMKWRECIFKEELYEIFKETAKKPCQV